MKLCGGPEQGGKRAGKHQIHCRRTVEIKEPKALVESGCGLFLMLQAQTFSNLSVTLCSGSNCAHGRWTGYNGLRNHGYLHEQT